MKNPDEDDTGEHLEGIPGRGKGKNESLETRKSTGIQGTASGSVWLSRPWG